jgi:peptidoglycan/LPS O-acetylase OafA/YrhL
MAFWLHQAIEELVGLLLIVQAVSTPDPALPLLAGLALIVLGLTADGPVALAKWVPRRVHRVVDVVVGVGLVVAAVVFRDQGAPFGPVLVAAGGLALLVLTWRTEYRPRKPRAAATEPELPSSGERYGKAAGRALGKGINVFRGKDDPT